MNKSTMILAVDDEKNILRLIQVNLAAEGFDVITASDGDMALLLMEEYKPDLVLLDIMMPGKNGYEVAKLIRERSPVPIIMLTAKADVASISRSLNDGADDYVTKPFDIHVLSARINSKLRRCRNNGGLQSVIT